MAVAFLSFLDSREKAVLIWTLIALTWAIIKVDGFLTSVGGILRTLCSKLLIPFALLASYCAGVILAAQAIELWHATAIKETVYWFFGTGVVLVGKAIESGNDQRWARKILLPALRLTLVVEFLVNLYVFPLGFEVVLVPLIVLVVLVEAVTAIDPEKTPVQRLSNGIITWIGFGLLAYVLIHVFSDPGGLLGTEKAEGLLVAPALTLVSFPVLFLVVRWVRWDAAVAQRRRQRMRRMA